MIAPFSERGFTVVELVITITLIGILVAPVVFSSLRFYVDVSSNNHKATLSLDSQAALAKYTEDIRMASGLDPINLINDSSQPSGWTSGGSENVLILSTPAQDSSGDFIIDPNSGEPYRNEIIYYSSGQQLYRRTLKNTSAPGNVIVQSCPAAATTPDCPADVKLTDNFNSVSYTFYDNTGTQTADIAKVRSVKIVLSMTDTSVVKPTVISNFIRVSMRNT